MDFLAVALGGAAGSVLRYSIQMAFRSWHFPAGTLLINLAGSFLIGLALALAERGLPWIRPTWLVAGFLGGFTTFSAFSIENMALLREGRIGTALLYMLVSVAGGVALAFAGYWLMRPTGT